MLPTRTRNELLSWFNTTAAMVSWPHYIHPLRVTTNIFAGPKPRLEGLLVNPITIHFKLPEFYNPIRAPHRCRGKIIQPELLNLSTTICIVKLVRKSLLDKASSTSRMPRSLLPYFSKIWTRAQERTQMNDWRSSTAV